MHTYRVTLTPADDYKHGEGWYFNDRGYFGPLYMGSDLSEARRVYNAIDMPAEAVKYNTAVERELAVLDEAGNPETVDNLCDIYDGETNYWYVLTQRHSQSSHGHLYSVDQEHTPYYVAAFQADRSFARRILLVTKDINEMARRCEGLDLTDEELKMIGLDQA